MAVVRIPDRGVVIDGVEAVAEALAPMGIGYERWTPAHPVGADAPAAEVLAAYGAEIDRLKAEGGFVTADVIDVQPDTPNLDVMLNKFNKEHWHDEDEVRFIIEGRGLFHLNVPGHPVCSVEVTAGDLLRVPRGTLHWFDLCGERRIRAIRLFQDPAGWAPHYTSSGVDTRYLPVCLGPQFVAGSAR
jgi:1,2-dihydroxy-3-keto-5-methylthiopentene dioxygenase